MGCGASSVVHVPSRYRQQTQDADPLGPISVYKPCPEFDADLVAPCHSVVYLGQMPTSRRVEGSWSPKQGKTRRDEEVLPFAAFNNKQARRPLHPTSLLEECG